MTGNRLHGGRALGIAFGLTAVVLVMAGGAGATPHKSVHFLQAYNFTDFILHTPKASMSFPENFQRYSTSSESRELPFPTVTRSEATERRTFA